LKTTIFSPGGEVMKAGGGVQVGVTGPAGSGRTTALVRLAAAERASAAADTAKV